MNFKKTEKQSEAIRLLSRVIYSALYGGSRSGKTFILIYALIVRASKTKSRHVVIRQTFNAVKRSVFLDTFPKVMRICFPNLITKDNRTDFYVTLPNGSEIWFVGLDNTRVEKILGMEFSTIYFNEASEMDYTYIPTILSRLAERNSLVNRVWFDFNPPKKSHWSYWLFIKKLDPIDEKPLPDSELYDHLLMNPIDNLDNIDEEYLKLLERMPEKDRDRFLNGLFGDVDDGAAYYSFNRETHVIDISRSSGSVQIGMDFNVNPMTAVVCQYIDNTLYVIDEAFLQNSDTFKMSDHLNRKNYNGLVYPDSTGRNRKTSGKSDFKILEENGFRLEQTRNPFVTDRVNNVNRMFQENRIVISPKCKKLINDLEKVSWKNNKLDDGPDKQLGHISDALGYILWKLDPLQNKRVSSTKQL